MAIEVRQNWVTHLMPNMRRVHRCGASSWWSESPCVSSVIKMSLPGIGPYLSMGGGYVEEVELVM